MPEDLYKVGLSTNRQLDEFRLRGLERDRDAWQGEPSSDLVERSQFNLFYDIGIHLSERESRPGNRDYAYGQLRVLAL